MAKLVTLAVEMTDEQAHAYALFYKRLSFSTFLEHTDAGRSCEERTEQAYEFRDALGLVCKDLNRQGYDPR